MAEVLLLVDDDDAFRSVYRELLGDIGYEVIDAGTADAARSAFTVRSPRLVVLDLMLPPSGRADQGAALCRQLLGEKPATKIIVVSGSADTQLALRVVEQGAYDFMTKPIEPDVLISVLGRAEARLRLEDRVAELETSLAAPADGSGLVGSSPAIRAACELAERVAPSDLPVLISGATGTGKEVFARHVHACSRRGEAALVAINCGALNANLLESALFGHRKGAFTGAVRDQDGLFVAAHRGTLFLDEIGDMDPALQVKLLRAVEAGEVMPVGAITPVPVDVRIVSATHRPLSQLVEEGRFREDLYWRIRGVEIELPRLAERAGDLLVLAQHFLNQSRALVPGSRSVVLSDEAVRAMEGYHWPGNLRELRHEMQRALVMAAGHHEILADHLSPSVRRDSGPDELDLGRAPLEAKIAALERREIVRALEETGGNKSQAAQRLGLSRQGLLNKIARHGLSGR
ncbi:MAG: sigma-54 dependent transcriptional regulator [Proteobacteria bacterium]|nr:sigma-54 dependent transcriptional regulator [Pseudomonadota bacterium]